MLNPIIVENTDDTTLEIENEEVVEDVEDIVEDGLLFDGSSIAGLASINDSDLLAKPDIDTFSTIPWSRPSWMQNTPSSRER